MFMVTLQKLPPGVAASQPKYNLVGFREVRERKQIVFFLNSMF